MSRILITGGTGLIGKHLSASLLAHGSEVFILTRQKSLPISYNTHLHYVYWNPTENYIDSSFAINNCKIINLAGAGVAESRWTKTRKQEILDSRVQSLETLYLAIQNNQIQATQLISASAIGYYGAGIKLFTEKDGHDDSFLSSICKQWEEAALKFTSLDLKVSIVRIGIVMSKDGGALKEFMKTLRFGIAAIPSDGKQIYSWIHIDDLCQLFEFISNNNKEGIFNAVAPNPCAMNEIFTALIKRTRPFFLKIHAPDFLLRIILGEMAIEILKSSTVSSCKIQEAGFQFSYESIDQCIASQMKNYC